MKPIGSLHSSHSSISPGLEALDGLPDLPEQEGLAVVQAELGGVGLLLGRLVHRIAADPVAVAVHRELEPGVGMVCEAVRSACSRVLNSLVCSAVNMWIQS